MIKIGHKREETALSNLPVEVVAKTIEIAKILDENYGESRHTEHDLGGYILIAEVQADIETIKKLIDFQDILPEYVDLIQISCASESEENYTSSLMIISSDFSISLIIPVSITPKELLAYLEE